MEGTLQLKWSRTPCLRTSIWCLFSLGAAIKQPPTNTPRRVQTLRHCGTCLLADVWLDFKELCEWLGTRICTPSAPRLKCMLRFCPFVCQLSLKCLVSKSEQINTHAQASRHFDAALASPVVAFRLWRCSPLGGFCCSTCTCTCTGAQLYVIFNVCYSEMLLHLHIYSGVPDALRLPRERKQKPRPPLVIALLRSLKHRCHFSHCGAVNAGSSETPALHESPVSALIEEAIR